MRALLACVYITESGERSVAVRRKVDGAWRDVTYRELGQIVQELALGFVGLGVEPGDRVAILCTTRPEWTYVDFALASLGAVVVPIYRRARPPSASGCSATPARARSCARTRARWRKSTMSRGCAT